MGSGIARKTSPRKMSAKREAALKAKGIFPRSTILGERKPVRKSNPERRAKRRAKFKARLNRADWKKLRLAVFARDGFRCTATVMFPNANLYPGQTVWVSDRCTTVSLSGRGLVADHLTYARFGHENLDDLRTLCRSCNARETKAKRANHAQGFLGSGAREGGV